MPITPVSKEKVARSPSNPVTSARPTSLASLSVIFPPPPQLEHCGIFGLRQGELRPPSLCGDEGCFRLLCQVQRGVVIRLR